LTERWMERQTRIDGCTKCIYPTTRSNLETLPVYLHCVQKETSTHVSFYISVENVQDSTKFKGMFRSKQVFHR